MAGDEDIVDLSDDVSSSHSSQRRRLDEEIQTRTAIFRKSAFQKCEVRLNPTPPRERYRDIGSRDGSYNDARQSSFSFRKRVTVSDVNRSDNGEDHSGRRKRLEESISNERDTIIAEP